MTFTPFFSQLFPIILAFTTAVSLPRSNLRPPFNPVKSSSDCFLDPAPGSSQTRTLSTSPSSLSAPSRLSTLSPPAVAAFHRTTCAPRPSWQCPHICSAGLTLPIALRREGQPPRVQCALLSQWPRGGVCVIRISVSVGMEDQMPSPSASASVAFAPVSAAGYWKAQFWFFSADSCE